MDQATSRGTAQVLRTTARLALIAGLVLSTAGLAVAAPVQVTDLVDGSGDGVSPLAVVNAVANCASDTGAVPVAVFGNPDQGPNGGLFHMNPFGNVYVSWWMTSEMGIGVDEYVFAADVDNDGGDARLLVEGPNKRSRVCEYVGNIRVQEFDFTVQGGGMGNQGESSCTATTWWKTTVEASVGVSVMGPTGSVKTSFEFGESTSCTESSLYDSEVVIGEEGDATIPPGGLLGGPVESEIAAPPG